MSTSTDKCGHPLQCISLELIEQHVVDDDDDDDDDDRQDHFWWCIADKTMHTMCSNINFRHTHDIVLSSLSQKLSEFYF